jgi:hypothetical protein
MRCYRDFCSVALCLKVSLSFVCGYLINIADSVFFLIRPSQLAVEMRSFAPQSVLWYLSLLAKTWSL